MKDLKKLLDLLFLEGELCCPQNDQFAYHSIPVKEILTGKVSLVSPNSKVPIKSVNSKDLILMAINPMKHNFRNDNNVSSYRTFLWEVDVGSISSQYNYIKTIGVPTSCTIFSGGKSLHSLTVLDQDIDEKTYRIFYRWALNIITLADQNCINPSRCVRIPGAMRPETNKEQKLVEFKGKVKLDDFINWLNKYEHLKPKERKKEVLTGELDYDKLSVWAKKQLQYGIDFTKGRNKTWFALSCDMFKSGYQENEIIDILESYFVEEHDFKHREFLTAVKSGIKHMEFKQ